MKKILSLVLTLCMLLSALPLGLSLAEEEAPAAETEVTQSAPEEEEVPAEKPAAPAEEEEKEEEGEEAPVKAEPAEEASEEEASAEESSTEAPAAPAGEEAPAEVAEDASEGDGSEAEPAEEDADPVEEAADPVDNTESGEEPSPADAPAGEEEEPLPELGLGEEDLIEKSVPKPEGLKVDSSTYNSVTLSWNPVASATSYSVWYSTSPTGKIDLLMKKGITATTYTAEKLTTGTEYRFAVMAYINSEESSQSAFVKETPLPAKPEWTTDPDYVDGIWQNPSTTVNLKWQQVDGADGYVIYRVINGIPSVIKEITSKTTLTYKETGMTMGELVEYQITAFTRVGDGYVESKEPNTTSIDLKPLAVDAATIKVTGSTSSSAVITWSKLLGTGEFTYNVLRANSSGAKYDTIATGLTALYYEDTNLIAGSKYYYRIVGVQNNTLGEESDFVEYEHKMAVVSGLTVSEQSAESLTLVWDKDSAAHKYLLQIGTSAAGPWTDVDSSYATGNYDITDNVDTYTVNGLTPSTTYYFQIAAVAVVGGSDQVGEFCKPVQGTTKPSPVEDLDAPETNLNYNNVRLTWTEPSTMPPTAKVIIRRVNGSTVKEFTVDSGIGIYDDTTVVCGTTYTYSARVTVTVSNKKLYSDYSNEVTVTPLTEPPASIWTFSLTSTSIQAEWDKVDDASGYNVYYRVVGDSDWTRGASVAGAANTKASISKLTPGELYEFTVTSYRNKASIESKQTEPFSECRPVPAEPKNVKVKVVNATALKVTWDSVAGAVGYHVYVYEEDTIGSDTYPSDYTDVYDVSTASCEMSELVTGKGYQIQIIGYVIDPDGEEQEGAGSVFIIGRPLPDAPTKLKIESVDSHTALLTWTPAVLPDESGAGYEIQFSDDGGSTFSLLVKLDDVNEKEYSDDTLTAGQTRIYQLRSVVPSEGINVYSEALTASISTKPATGTELTLTSSGTTEILLTFKGEDGATPNLEYHVWRKNGSGSYEKMTTNAVWNTDHWEYDDTAVVKGIKYTYKVRPVIDDGLSPVVEGADSAPVSGMSQPAVPTSITAKSLNATAMRVTVDAVFEASGYEIQRSLNPTEGYATKGTTAASDDGGSTYYYDDKTTVTGTTYYFRARAYYTYGSNTKVYGDWGYLDPPDDVNGVQCLPVPPTDFKISTFTHNSVTLTWKKTVGTNCSYYINYDDETDSITDIVPAGGEEIPLNTQSFKIEGLTIGHVYTFRIWTRCKLAGGAMVESVDWAEITSEMLVPAKVTGLKGVSEPPTTFDKTKNYNKLTWNAVEGATSYNIWRKDPGATSFNKIGSATEPEYYDATPVMGKIYTYYVEAVGPTSTCVGEKSAEVKVSTLPLRVTGLVITVVDTTTLQLDWDDMGVDSYQIYRSTSNGKLGSLITTETTNTYNDTVKCGTTYYYTVKGVKVESGTSFVGEGSLQIEGKALPPKPIINTTADVSTPIKAIVYWTPGAGAIDGYELYYRPAGESAWKKGGTAKKTLTEGICKVPTSGMKYEFAVRSYKTVSGSKKYSEYSDPTTALLVEPPEVTGLTIVTMSATGVKISWDKQPDASGYVVYTSYVDGAYADFTDKENANYVIAPATVTTNTYTMKKSRPGQKVWFKVVSYKNQSGGKIYGYENKIEDAVNNATSEGPGWILPGKATLSLKSNTVDEVKLGWKAVTGASGYVIMYATAKAGPYSTLVEIGDGTQTEFLHNASTDSTYANQTYYYMIQTMVIQENGGTKVYGPESSVLTRKKK